MDDRLGECSVEHPNNFKTFLWTLISDATTISLKTTSHRSKLPLNFLMSTGWSLRRPL
ncbi:hypothetical protein QQP08_015202 [Theobroma cacao]|nr:hypothetical protein QQP08_015202 [Theobroma cacao]